METISNWFCRISLIIMVFICANSILGDILFRLHYSFPKISETTTSIINTHQPPIQTDLQNSKYIKAYGEKNIYVLHPQAQYSISGMVVARNNNFWFRDIMRNKFDDIALLDLGIVWGELAEDKNTLYKYVSFNSKKTLGQSRTLYTRWKGNNPWGSNYIMTHFSHTHMIPANANIMGALLQIKKNDIIKLDGYLVDIYTDKSELIAKTSMSRSDKNATSRGYGACEDMYVKQVQIGNKIYR